MQSIVFIGKYIMKTIPDYHQKRLKYIGTFLRELRLNDGLTQSEVCSDIKMHRNSLIRVEGGNYSYSIVFLFELADYYNISVNEFIKEVE
jgi:transcriptional regulator with XRE-family HTH domain